MKKLLVVLLMVISLGCSNYIYGVRYAQPVPTQEYYLDIRVDIYVYDWEDFQKAIIQYFGEEQPGCVGFTVWGDRYSNDRNAIAVFILRKSDGTIDLETLGHEMFYHVMMKRGH